MSFLLVMIVAGYVAYAATVLREGGFLTANGVFASIQLLMAVGTFPLLESDRPADVLYARILTYTSVAFFVASGLLHAANKVRRVDTGRSATFISPSIATGAGIAVSIAVVILYFRAVGYSAFVEGLLGRQDIATLRIESYSGSRYLFPGYVNQFKNALLPALVLVVVTYWSHRRQRHRILSLLLVGSATFGLLGTGQRGAFVLFVAVTTVYLRHVDPPRFKPRMIRLAVVVVPLLLLATVALGRDPQLDTESSSVAAKAASAVSQFQYRILGSNQDSAVAGFRYIYDQPITNGAEWEQAVAGLLPGNRGSDLSNRIYATMFGTTRGTAPPSIWGSIYHNFGLGGIAVAPLLLAGLCGMVTRRSSRSGVVNSIETVGMAGTSVVLGFWAAGDPVTLLNTGLPVYLLLWWHGERLSNGSNDGMERATRHKERPGPAPCVQNGSREARST